MMQFQVRKDDVTHGRLSAAAQGEPGDGEILVGIDRFAFSANNVTYGVAGHTLGYWHFFPVGEGDGDDWGVLPVWGFADVVASNSNEVSVGERLYGYFPPAGSLILRPKPMPAGRVLDTSEHRKELPVGYNLYSRVTEGFLPEGVSEDEFMLLNPLFVTAFSLADMLAANEHYGAKQVVLLSASSKTSVGLAYALNAIDGAPPVIGVTSDGNVSFTETSKGYDRVVTYETMDEIGSDTPTVIVDMSGNSRVLGALHGQLGDNMRKSIDVGLTHWEEPRARDGIIRERREFFFAPKYIQQRMKEWGPEVFDERLRASLGDMIAKTRPWLTMRALGGLEGLADIYRDVALGKMAPEEGLIVLVKAG